MNHVWLDLMIHVELNYHLFIISLDKCNRSCNAVDSLSIKICVVSKTKDNVITRINEAKTLVKHISCDCKCKFNSTTFNSNQNWNNDACQWECKKYRKCTNYYTWNPSTCVCENDKYLKKYCWYVCKRVGWSYKCYI